MAERDGFSAAEKKVMLLSKETSLGLKVTGMWISIMIYLYKLLYIVSVLMHHSEVFC